MSNSKAIKWISVVTVVLIFILAIVLVFEFVKINELKNKEKLLLNSVSNLEQSIVDYTNANDYLNSSDYVEDYARENLGWGAENEIRFESK